MPSGLWHQAQFSGQPFRKTVVRMPGPSCTEYFWMLKTKPRSMLATGQALARRRRSCDIYAEWHSESIDWDSIGRNQPFLRARQQRRHQSFSCAGFSPHDPVLTAVQDVLLNGHFFGDHLEEAREIAIGIRQSRLHHDPIV